MKKKTAKRIGVFGGSFDPIHLGHLHLAEAMRKAWSLDEVVFIPVKVNPHKQDKRPIGCKERLEMIALAIKDKPYFKVDALESERAGPSYTVDTLRALKEKDPLADFYLILGEDAIESLMQWKDLAQVLTLATLIIGTRHSTYKLLFHRLDPAIRSYAEAGYTSFTPLPISSTEIRLRIREGADCSSLIPKEVFDYIKENRLYFNPVAVLADATVSKVLHTIAQTLYDKSALNIIGLNVKEICSMTDYFIIAEGRVARHLSALSKAVIEAVGKLGEKPLIVDGSTSEEWVVIDYGDIVVHLMTAACREKYELELLWHEGSIVDLHIKTGVKIESEGQKRG